MKLSERMKHYESITDQCLPENTDIIIRADGRCFHTLLRDEVAFSDTVRVAMMEAAQETARDLFGRAFVTLYTQSDEVSFLISTRYSHEARLPFAGRLNKLTSLTAASMTAWFSQMYGRVGLFDARVFMVPEQDVSNYFLWRMHDTTRNSLIGFCREFYTHAEMLGKGKEEQHELLHAIDKNWARDVPASFRNGLFYSRDNDWTDTLRPAYGEIDDYLSECFIHQNLDEYFSHRGDTS